jgi:beta-lactamase superfamily II metal-dependent hydrolase
MLSDPPTRDEVEVSIFGPGKGESVLVHLGDDRWIIVDSCIDQMDRSMPALAYLERIGVDAAKSVLMVLATHAHDDHIAGIAEIFQACESAFFACSSALTKEEFLALIEADARVYAGIRGRAFSEYDQVFKIVWSRSGKGPDFRPLKYAMESRPLLQLDGPHAVKVVALSPSDEAFRRSLLALKSVMPVVGSRRGLSAVDPNELAVALWVEVGDKAILLGADLLTGPNGCGWIAVLNSISHTLKASVFKVPHHGSGTAHHDGIWSNLLGDSPIALLAPFRGGRMTLPSRDDRARICSLTPNAFVTAAVQRPGAALPVDVKKEAASLGPLVRKVREAWGSAGHVRARSRAGETEWVVTSSAPARPLCHRRR